MNCVERNDESCERCERSGGVLLFIWLIKRDLPLLVSICSQIVFGNEHGLTIICSGVHRELQKRKQNEINATVTPNK